MINKILGKFGLILLKKSFYTSHFRLRNQFLPLSQLFYKTLHDDFFFVQIGANDGISFDPIYELVTKEKVKGIAIEPMPDIFKLLEKNYDKHPNVKLLNLAIHKDQTEMKMYRVDPKKTNYPDWTKGTPSFNKDHHKLGNIPEYDIIEESVKCISFDALIKEYSINRIDLLQIDTEGYDLEIIKMINFNQISPRIISFEHGMRQGIINMNRFVECQTLLFENDYNIIILDNDAIAFKNNI
ncbi:FkbM family methyltransferase [Flavobacterium chungbukense]|uniref:Methyltransferase FkbM domain-containing protein n=1 Tax=Flavobacterium chungbukense TaxID=877464 RepID=A0ABP7XJX9_9FLAO|nr:FkbM family methyltransferase [Flavobacterium chungbukense]MCC4922951.1 FkbM family methyltransferase [Flavobacterium chungbukense]